MTVTTDQNSNEWTKTYDAMGRHRTTVTPTVSSTYYTNTKWYDGNGNVVKVTDLNSHDTEYVYNQLNQRTRIREVPDASRLRISRAGRSCSLGAGGGGGDVDIDFTFNCCRMTGYDDQLATTASLSYDEFARLTQHTDNQGYQLQYEYDSMNRVVNVTDHTSKDTEYAYDLMGRTATVTYDPSGSNRVTTYTYDANSNTATVIYANNYKSSYTYDSGNRTTQQKIENTTPSTLEQFDYNYSPGGLPSNTFGYTRSENSAAAVYTIAFDRLNRLKLEKFTEGIYTRYQYEHSYDSAGNRTNLTISGTWHAARNFGYNYNGMGHMLTVTENTNLSNYTATVTTDANGNLTEIEEVRDVSGTPTTVSTNTFEYDRENRLIEQTVDSNQNVTVAHAYDGLGRLVRTSRTVSGPTTTEYRHVRDGLKLQGNVDYTNTQTAPSWTNHTGRLMPIESQQLQTNASQQYINIADEYSPARLTYHPSTSAAGDTSTVNAKGSYSVINGAAPPINATTLHSELFYHRNMTVNQNSIALSSDRGSLEIAGVSLLYEGTRVKSYLLGRDLNPMGRGDGALYAEGMFSAGNTRPIPNDRPVGGRGNSVNNGCGGNGVLASPCAEAMANRLIPELIATTETAQNETTDEFGPIKAPPCCEVKTTEGMERFSFSFDCTIRWTKCCDDFFRVIPVQLIPGGECPREFPRAVDHREDIVKMDCYADCRIIYKSIVNRFDECPGLFEQQTAEGISYVSKGTVIYTARVNTSRCISAGSNLRPRIDIPNDTEGCIWVPSYPSYDCADHNSSCRAWFADKLKTQEGLKDIEGLRGGVKVIC